MARFNTDGTTSGCKKTCTNAWGTLKRRARAALVAAVGACSLFSAAQPADAGAVDPGEDFFPIAVWQQPTNSFNKWKSRGVNTLMGVPMGNDADAWATSAINNNLYQIRQPRLDISLDVNDPTLLAWMHEDEPDYRKTPPATLAADYAAYKAIDPAKPVLVNFSGGNLLQGTPGRAAYEEYMASADWISNDIYPITGWDNPEWIDYSLPAAERRNPATAVDRLRQWSGGKPQWAVIESSNQNLSWVPDSRGVTREELRGQLWQSIIHGAKGVVYFPMQIGGFKFDVTPADVAEEMTLQNARIQSLAGIINSTPSRAGLTLNFGSPLLEGTSRRYKGMEYYFVLNMSSTPLDDQAISLPTLGVPAVGVVGEGRSLIPSGGQIFDDFAPYEMHVYQAGTKGYSIFDGANGAIPEPTTLGALGFTLILLRRRQR